MNKYIKLTEAETELVTIVLKRYTPENNTICLDSPEEVLQYFDYLKDCGYSVGLHEAQDVLYNNLFDNLKLLSKE